MCIRDRFDTVINLPADQVTIGGSIGNPDGAATPTTQLNVGTGGEVISNFNTRFRVNGGVEANISGGNVGSFFAANNGSSVNFSGGSFGEDFNANDGSTVNISGGSFDRDFNANSGSDVSISGGNFGFDFTANAGSGVELVGGEFALNGNCLLYTSPSPRDRTRSRMPSSA